MSERVELADVLNLLDGARDYGAYTSFLCPFHPDHTNSAMLFKSGYWYCMACGAKGGLQKLYRQLQGWEAPVRVAAEATSSGLPYLPQELYEQEELTRRACEFLLQCIDPLGNYLKRRGIFDCIRPQRLGYHHGWYTIPVFNRDHRFEGFVLRASPDVQTNTGKRFHIPYQQPALVYVPDYRLVEQEGYMVVVYGMFDALSFCACGIPSCTPTAGKLSMTPDRLEDFRIPLLVFPDKGEEDTGRKLSNGLGWRGKLVSYSYPDDCKDPNDILVKYGKETLIDIVKGEL